MLTQLWERIKAIPPRMKLLIAVGLFLLLAVSNFGPLNGCNDVEIDADRAVEIARQQIDFEPERTEVRLLRQGMGHAWVVVFTISDPDGGRNDFLKHSTVRIDPATSEVLDVTHLTP